jgi:hypothetical protein
MVVCVYPAPVPETFVALRELVLMDVLEELLGVVGEPYPRAEEAQADYARFALAISVLKLDKCPAYYPLQAVVRFLGV